MGVLALNDGMGDQVAWRGEDNFVRLFLFLQRWELGMYILFGKIPAVLPRKCTNFAPRRRTCSPK